MSSTHSKHQTLNQTPLAETWQLRFDILADPASPEITKQFADSWAEQLETQKLTSIVGSKSHPEEVRLQVCISDGGNSGCERSIDQIVAMLNRVWNNHNRVAAECIRVDSGEWQGFRLWLTYDRHKAEDLFAHKKPKKRFGSRLLKKLRHDAESNRA
jgi:hypothetical protein